MSLFLCEMSIFLCIFMCLISSYSFLLVVDTSSIPMIPLTSLWLSYVYTEKKQNLYVLCFSFSILSCRWSTNSWELHPTALWTLFFFKYPNSYKINILNKLHINVLNNNKKDLFLTMTISHWIEQEWSAAYILKRQSIQMLLEVWWLVNIRQFLGFQPVHAPFLFYFYAFLF